MAIRANQLSDSQGTETAEPAAEMSFLDHLEELRARLVRSAIALMACFFLCWFFSDRIFNFVQVPVVEALAKAQTLTTGTIVHTLSVDQLTEGAEVVYTFRVETTLGDTPVPAGATVKGRVVRREGKLVVVTAEPWVLGNAVIPAEVPLPLDINENRPSERLVIDTVQGAFNLYIRVSFYAAILFAMPIILYQLWGFIAPGLYQHERRYVFPFVGMGTVFFISGAAFGYYIAFPRAALWLLQLGSGFRPLIKADEYFDLIIIIMLGLGAVFQIPTVTFFLARIGMVTADMMWRPWRMAILIIAVLAAVISPTGDVPNMLVFALPMLLLYFLSIGIAWVFGRPRTIEV